VLEILQIQLVLNDIIGYGILLVLRFKNILKKIIYFYFHIILMLDAKNKIVLI